MTTKYEWISGGVRKEHVVTKQPGETVEEYLDRAESEFIEKLAEFPPD